MLGVTMHEVSQFLSGSAALIVAMLGVMKFLLNKQEKRINTKTEETLEKILARKLEENLLRLATQAGPSRTRGIDIAFCDIDVALRIPVILDQWAALPWGLWICGVDFAHASTSYLVKCDTTSRLLSHTHEGTETVTVIQGKMEDLDSGKVYLPGTSWEIPAESPHAVHFHAPTDGRSFLALVTVRPALPNPAHTALDLKGLQKLLDPRD